MIRLKGKVPGVDIEIVTTGMRKGEKRHEALTYAYEELETTRVDGVNRVVCEPPQNELLEKQISVLMDAARRHETLEALRLLGNLVPEYGAALAATRRRKPA